MAKKYFLSLMLGFGATLGVLVAVAMPPGSWAVVVGVLLGMMCCIPVLLVMFAFLNRGNNTKQSEPQQPVQPVILVQPPYPQGYSLPQQGYPQNGYMLPQYEAYDYPYQPAEMPRRLNKREQQRYSQRQRQLPERKRRQQEAYYDQEYYGTYQQDYYYDDPSALAEQYDAYYGQQPVQPEDYGYWTGYQEEQAPRGKQRSNRPNNDVVEAEFRTLGDY